MVVVDFRFLKTMAIALSFVFLLAGCALYVRDGDEFEHHRWHHHEFWDRSLRQAPQSSSLMAAIPNMGWAYHGDLER